MNRVSRFLLIIGAIIIVLLILVYLYPRIAVLVFIRSKLSQESVANIVPIERIISKPIANQGLTRYSNFGYSFQLPLKDISQTKKGDGSIIVYKFSNSKSLTLFSPETNLDVQQVLSQADDSYPKYFDLLKEVYGSDKTKSEYDLNKLILSVTPQQFNFFTPWKKLIIGSTL